MKPSLYSVGCVVTALLCLITQVCQQAQAQRGHSRLHTKNQPADLIDVEVSEDEELNDYNNYTLLRIQVRDEDDIEVINSLHNQPGVDIWRLPSADKRSADALLSPQVYGYVNQLLQNNEIPYSISIDNVKTAIESSDPQLDNDEVTALIRSSGHAMNWKSYQRHKTILDFLDHVAQLEGSGCESFTLGYSYEGRRLAGVKCGQGKKAIFIEGGIHAREWISPAVVTYIINEIAQNPHEQPTKISRMLELYTIYLVPVTNPDGYEFTHTKNRLWRKTRSKNWSNLKCPGVDPNRNFDVEWMESGSSSSPCSEIYAGPKPFSERETRALRDFILKHNDTIQLYISVHSYGQMILVPYAFTTERPPDFDRTKRVARIGAKALREAGGPAFAVDQTSWLMYPASGGSDDWTKLHGGVPYSYTFELRDDGGHGFLLPPSLIEQSGRETLEAVLAMAFAVASDDSHHSYYPELTVEAELGVAGRRAG